MTQMGVHVHLDGADGRALSIFRLRVPWLVTMLAMLWGRKTHAQSTQWRVPIPVDSVGFFLILIGGRAAEVGECTRYVPRRRLC